MADVADENFYLASDFDPNQLTIPKLRSILLKHNVRYPPSAKKAVMVDLFNEHIAPQAARMLQSNARTKPSTRGIVDVPSSQESTTDDAEEDQTLVPPTPRRTSRRARAGTEEEPTRTVGGSRRKTPSSAVPAKHVRTSSDVDVDERPVARRTRHSVTPAFKENSPELQLRHRQEEDSPFSADNPFQSGSSPPTAKVKDRRRRTTGLVDQREKRKSDVHRRRTAQANVEQYDDGFVVPARSSFDVRSTQLPMDTEAVEPGEEFTPDEQLALARERVKTGQLDVLPPRRRKQPSNAKGTLKAGVWTMTLAALAGFAGVWRQEKLAVGYCGMGQESTSLAGLQIPEWANEILPACEPCPAHAYCYKNLETTCEQDYVLKPHPLSLNGLIPLPPSCEPDSEKARRISTVTDRSVDILRKRRAEYECGELDKEGKPVTSPEMGEAELKQEVASMKRKGMSQDEFEDLWKSAIGSIVARDEVEQSTDRITGGQTLTSTSYAALSLSCSLKRAVRQSFERHLRQLIGLITFIGLMYSSWQRFQTNRQMETTSKQLASDVFDRLAQHAALNLQEPGAYHDLGISETQLRDDVLRTEWTLKKRLKLWEKVQKKVENNTNVRAAIRETHNGDVARVWEWIGPIRQIETGPSTGRRDRYSLGSVIGSSPPREHAMRKKIVNVPKTRRTYCKGKECKKHTQHKVTQYKAGKASLFAQGKRRYDRKQSGYGGQTKPVFHKRAKTTKKVVLRLECTQCKTKAQLALKRCKHFELGGDKKTKGAALVF
ncbi:hypothetical protein GQ43DRAFT_373760 [Delitschia confertaspora ATCC 74209]|uniref:LEM-like domain-containing protein n=1 Tax=Delitschia confertaspora ATCC 74209 TaxID=1513339 RepID=A0A9P4MPB6_9PLEO|nr:hypothetical protein GQ43DRAFT_373760 [Delitschia confertaspora ATCC 74209]